MPPKKQLSHAVYTVGLITALPKELAAVRAMLDEEHDRPGDFERHPRDNNSYVWGNVGAHNVVLASLPSGIYGLVSAATTASQFLSSFPHIRFGLMVGIGAGIPRGNFDIRLGDVIVSKPEGESPGVVQYDLGKIEKDGHFHRVGSLAPPPDFLLTALGKLESEHLLQDSQIPDILLEMLHRYPALAKPKNNRIPYVYQGVHNDRLFLASAAHVESPRNQAEIVHPGQRPDNMQTEVCASCDSSKEIKRQPRSSTEPVIHYGVMASGNSVVKDGVSRDKILRRIDPKCICFEMEAAGLMRTFPGLVIRGVCDYADTHKNDRWQNYAAAAAAAYAKELLLQVDPVDVLQARNIKEVMEGLTDKVSGIALNAEETKQDTQKLKIIAQGEKVDKWLCALEISTVHNAARNLRHKDTGRWFLEIYDYLSWKRASKSSLWLYGKPGSGKTILSSTIIENLSPRRASLSDTESLSNEDSFRNPVLYFYFAFNDSRRQSLDDAIRSLIHQLYFQSHVARDRLNSHLDIEKHNHRQPDTDFLCEIFKTMVRDSGGASILLDALDECQTRADSGENQGLLSWIKGLNDSDINLRFLITSRPEYDIKSTLGKSANYQVNLSGWSVNKDIETYVYDSISKHSGLKRWFSREYEDLREQIKRDLTENADGMFRWVYCQLQDLTTCNSPTAVRKQLKSLPKTLADTYAAILRRIPEHSKEQVIRLLQFLVSSERPLLVEEVVDALAVEIDDKVKFDPKNRMPLPEEISLYCSSMVIIVDTYEFRSRSYGKEKPGKKEVQLAHATVKEYLLSIDRLSRDVSAHFSTSLARSYTSSIEVCLAYMISVDPHDGGFLAFDYSPFAVYIWNEKERDESIPLVRRYPLIPYAEAYWASHLAQAMNTPRVVALFGEFVDCKIFQQILNKSAYFSTQLCHMASLGLTWALDVLLKSHPNLTRSKRYSYWRIWNPKRSLETPLEAAIHHEDTLRLLLARGAPVSEYSLQLARSRGDDKLVGLLLEYEDPTSFGRDGVELDIALKNGNLETMQMIIRKWPYSLSGRHLCDAFKNGHSVMVKTLLDEPPYAGFYIDSLKCASTDLNFELMESILTKAPGPITHGVQMYPLYGAVQAEHTNMVRLLLKRGASVHDHCVVSAAGNGCEEILNLLLENGGNPNAKVSTDGPWVKFTRTALQFAQFNRHENVVRILFRHGAQDMDEPRRSGTVCTAA